ncbi:MAG: HAD hydrolase family protein [Desulfurococcales archaeon]|nr:HAD hydrolase family protein [Desulfurococcales archaeon]
MRIQMIATDVDGTLTIRRGELLLSLEAVRAIRELEENGITVSLVSGNSLPITAGLARYIGAKGPVIA